jgi:hypothetical protein
MANTVSAGNILSEIRQRHDECFVNELQRRGDLYLLYYTEKQFNG